MEEKYEIDRKNCKNKLEEKKWWEKYKVGAKLSGERALYSTQV